MSEIKFSASLDKSALDAAIKESKKNIGDWVKDVEKAGGSIDQGFNKVGKASKDAIKEQKLLIKSIEKDVKDLEKTLNDTSPGIAKKGILDELTSARKALAEEQASLLGLQKQQIESNSKEADSQESIIGKLKGWALGLVSVGAAMKIGKDIIESTNTTADKFEQVIAGATSGVQYFFKAIASGDFSNFWEGMGKAISGAVEFVEIMDDINSRTNEQKIASSEAAAQIAELRSGTFDKGIENNDKLIENTKKIIEIQKQDYANQAAIAKDKYDETLKQAALDNNIDKTTLDNLITEYTKNEEILKKGQEYNDLIQARTRMSRAGDGVGVQTINADILAMGEAGKAAGQLAKEYGRVPKELRNSLADLKSDYIQLEGQAKIGSRRDENLLAQAENKRDAAEKESKEKAVEALELQNQIAEQVRLLEKAIKDGNYTEMNAIAERIVALREELRIREQIKNNAIISASMNTEGMQPMTGIGLTSESSSMPKILADKTTSRATRLAEQDKKTAAANKKELEQITKTAEEQQKLDEQKIRNQKEILNGALQLTYQMGQQVGLSEESLNLLGAELDAVMRLASGDYIGAAISLLSGLISTLGENTDSFQSQIEQLNAALSEQERLIERSNRIGGKDSAISAKIDLLKKEREEYEKAIGAINMGTTNRLASFFGIGISQSNADKQINELNASLREVDNNIQDAEESLEDFLTGGVTQETIADVIAQGFQDGKTSIDDFAEYMNEVLMNAVMEVFKAEVLGESLNSVKKTIQDSLSDKVLTEEEKTRIDNRVKEVADANKELWDNLTGAISNKDISSPGLSGQISRSITEETGTELAGLMRNQRDGIMQIRDYSRIGIDRLASIEANTYNTVVELKSAVTELRQINTNTKQSY